MGNVNATNARGAVWRSLGTGQNDGYWDPDTGSGIKRVGGTLIVPGPLVLAQGGVNYICPLIVPVSANEIVALVGVRGFLRDGATATMNIQQNGASISGLSGASAPLINTSPGASPFYLSSGLNVSDGDYFSPVFTSFRGTPGNLSLCFVFDITS